MPGDMLVPGAREMDLDSILLHFAEHGYARLGRVLDDEGILALRQRTDDMMFGRVTYPGLFFQKDSQSGSYDDLQFGRGYEGPGDHYRKVEKIEWDPVFLKWLENPLFERIARRWIEGPIAIYRAVIFSKAKSGGTELGWHQDGGRFWGLDRDPTLQIWTGLDDAEVEAGCVEVIPGSHREGLRTPFGGSIPNEVVEARGQAPVFLSAVAGEAILIHNHAWHRSGINRSGHPRRALSFCYMSADTRCVRKKRAPREFFPVFR